MSRSKNQIKDLAPREFRGPTKRIHKGLLIIFTGDGKGKSTAAFGTALRSIGRGYRVGIVQFIKGKWMSGEIVALKKYSDQVDYFSVGEGFTWETKNLKRDISLAKNGWKVCKKMLRDKRYHLLIFDELLYVLKYKFLSSNLVCSALRRRSVNTHVILTGRDAAPQLKLMADLVSEIQEIKHPFKQGILAQPGVDY